MSKKKTTSNDRSKDRHRPRRMIAVPPDVYDQMKALAEENGRPLNWQVKITLIEALKAAGKWPPPETET